MGEEKIENPRLFVCVFKAKERRRTGPQASRVNKMGVFTVH